ncbi:hypothetical protein [Roseovarius sp.]|uniref:hypothetical protein n=1 Tax=Roseovarius sp. TaxID=1486281 RepID=UPI003BAB040A
MTRYALIAALVAAIAAAGWIALLRIENSALQAENERLGRSVVALKEQAAQSALAREVESARAKRWQARSKELSAAIEGLLTGDIKDAPLDPDLADRINSLRGD